MTSKGSAIGIMPAHKKFAVVYEMMDHSIKYDIMTSVSKSAAVKMLQKKRGVRMVISVRPAALDVETRSE